MMELLTDNKYRRVLIFMVFGWLFLVTTDISKTISLSSRVGKEVELMYAVVRAFSAWGIIAIYAPVIWKLSERFPLRKGKLMCYIPVHVFASILIMPLHAFLFRVVMELYYQEGLTIGSLTNQTLQVITGLGIISIFSYWLIVGVYHALMHYEQYQERELQNLKMDAELTQARLQVLSMQLHPHFLFNTLHNVNTLIFENVEKADELLDKLKHLLREGFLPTEEQEVKLTEEMDFIARYLDIEKIRFSDRLHIEWRIDEETRSACVPRFILQPIVENAIRHGVSMQIKPVTIRISARKIKNMLQLRVEDSGPGLESPFPRTQLREGRTAGGVGMFNTQKRLELIYSDYRFDISESPLGGVSVLIEIPCHAEKQHVIG